MTSFLARIQTVEETETALEGGADAVVVMRPSAHEAGPPYVERVRRVGAAMGGRVAVCATLGEGGAPELAELAEAGAATIFMPAGGKAARLGRPDRGGEPPALFATFRDACPSAEDLDALLDAGVQGVLLEGSGRLVDGVGLPERTAFAKLCRARTLAFGFSGGLEPPDVPRLLGLGPDCLVFRQALCRAGSPCGTIEGAAVRLIRDLIRRAPSRFFAPSAPAGVGSDPQGSPPDAALPPPPDSESVRRRGDRIFVRDLMLPMAIGAYASEHGREQRVRFTVEAEILASGRPARDMRDVVSYDLITDAIRQLAGSGHVEFVETLAEDIAASVLAHPRVLEVRVMVEKLDLGPGSVGVEIWRTRGDARG